MASDDKMGDNFARANRNVILPKHRKLHDSDVSFEEYHYYALKTREEQRTLSKHVDGHRSKRDVLFRRNKPQNLNDASNDSTPLPEKIGSVDEGTQRRVSQSRFSVSDEEWSDASRMMRTATAGAMFYLITTDILGPYGVGFAIGTLGWGPGIALYTVFGFMAGYGGWLLWRCYMGLDSYEFPIRNYGDLGFRIYGPIPRQCINILQGILLICILGQVTLQNGQGLSQVGKFRLCYAVCCVIFVAVGFAIGQVRTLKNYGWLASCAVYLNLLVIFITMGVMAHSPPNYAISVLGSAGGATLPETITPNADGVYPPIIHFGGLPNPKSFVGSLNGLLSGVFAYGGSQLFIEYMAEMRQPRDFIKAMWAAQFFIYVVYLVYGSYVYYWQGQYSYQISYQGVSIYAWQTVGNMLAVLSGLIAAGLYSNIGIKVFYNNVLMDLFKAPPLTTHGGKILWVIIVPIWWSIAFVIAAAIPDYFGFVSIVSAICVIQFSYSFPPILVLGYDMQKNSLRGDDGFDPSTGEVRRTYRGVQKWIKGFYSGRWYGIFMNVWHVIFAGGSLATAGLGAYAAIEGMIEAFQNPQVNSFSCRSPLDLSAA